MASLALPFMIISALKDKLLISEHGEGEIYLGCTRQETGNISSWTETYEKR